MRFPVAPRSAALLAAVLLAACAGGPEDEEMWIANDRMFDRDGRTLEQAAAKSVYNAAREFLAAGNPLRALELYREVQTRFPFTDYATQAELESITAQYQAYQFDAAISTADRFVKQHPRHPNIDYVYYLRGLINYERVGGDSFVGGDQTQRDPTHLRQAFTTFNLLVQNFPDSPYNKDAQLRMIEIKHRLAANELSIAEYYLRRRAWVAASRRAESIIELYQGSDSVPRALEIMEHSYRILGLEQLAQDARTILQTSYPNYILHREEFYRQRAGLEPRYELPPVAGPPAATAAPAEK
jgi:outer membrane protein assembly factor BamD